MGARYYVAGHFKEKKKTKKGESIWLLARNK